jgi:hypothetical protein
LLWGDPIPAPDEDTDVNHFSQVLEDALNELLRKAEQTAKQS